MERLRVLYVAHEISPFLQTTAVADFVRKLSFAMQEKGLEIRVLVPRFGVINERKNRLHEVVRLSGINISVGEEEKSLVIKVASVPNAKLQIYFIDNEDYFQRKSIFYDADNNFLSDNDERAIFFCKGTLETVRKLSWVPDIIHCNDWITALIPLYLKTTYKKDPIFKNTKCVFSAFDSHFDYQFPADVLEKARMNDVEEDMLPTLQQDAYKGLLDIAFQYSDLVTKGQSEYQTLTNDILLNANREIVEYASDESDYYELYKQLYHEPAVVS